MSNIINPFLAATGGPTWNDLDTGTYDTKSLGTNPPFLNPASLLWYNSGSNAVMIQRGANAYQYSFTTAYDISTGSYDTVTAALGTAGLGNENSITAGSFGDSGNKLYTTGIITDKIDEFDLSTPYSIAGGSISFNQQSTVRYNNPYGLTFNDDGTKVFWVNNNTIGDVYEVPLSTPWDVSTMGSFTAFSIVTESIDTRYVAFGDSGFKFYVAEWSGSLDGWHQYSMSTAYDITTASYDSVFFKTQPTTTSGPSISANGGLSFKPDGTKFYISDHASDAIYQYSL